MRGTRESFRKSTVTTVTPVKYIIKLSKNSSAKIQHFSSNSKYYPNYFCTECVMACIELVVLVDIESTDSLTPVKWFFDSSQTIRWLKSTNGLHGIQHRFPNESHRVSSVLRFEKLRMEFEQSWAFLIENPENVLSFRIFFVSLRH